MTRSKESKPTRLTKVRLTKRGTAQGGLTTGRLYATSTVIVVGVCAGLIGCTSVVSSNPRQVIVESQMMNAQEAQRLAEAECGKNKRYARMAIKADYWERNYTFDCVE